MSGSEFGPRRPRLGRGIRSYWCDLQDDDFCRRASSPALVFDCICVCLWQPLVGGLALPVGHGEKLFIRPSSRFVHPDKPVGQRQTVASRILAQQGVQN